MAFMLAALNRVSRVSADFRQGACTAIAMGLSGSGKSMLEHTLVTVTHDPMVASYADRFIFLADGRAVDELIAPTVRVLDRMKGVDAKTRSR